MYEAAKVRFRSLIEGELARSGSKDRAALDAAFAKLDASLDGLIAGKKLDGAQAGALRKALAEVKAEHLPARPSPESAGRTPPELAVRAPAAAPSAMPPPPAKPARSLKRWIGGGLAAAAAVGAVILVPSIAAALQAAPAKPDRHLAVFQSRLDGSTASVELLTTYLRQIRKSMEQRRKADPIALATLTGGGWTAVEKLDPALFGRKPKLLPAGSDLKLRVDGEGYKVLLRTALCTDVKYIRPAFVDPKRDPKSAGCEYLAVWNEAGAKF